MLTRKKTQVVVFDCDGVLFDSRTANTHFYNHILARFGLPPMNAHEAAYAHMHTADESIRHLFQQSEHLEEALAFRWAMDYSPFIRDMIMEPGLSEVLSCLSCNTGLAVATNRSNTIHDVLEHNRLDSFFDLVVSSLDVRRPKPHPEPLFKIMAHFEVAPENVLYVGDSQVDAQTAQGAGVPFIAYKDPGLPAQYHVEDLWEVAAIALSE